MIVKVNSFGPHCIRMAVFPALISRHSINNLYWQKNQRWTLTSSEWSLRYMQMHQLIISIVYQASETNGKTMLVFFQIKTEMIDAFFDTIQSFLY